MRHYHHLTLQEREEIMVLNRQGYKPAEIAAMLGRHRSTISRELARNVLSPSYRPFYRASTAQKNYRKRRKACRREGILAVDTALRDLICEKLLDHRWSPEQIEGRLALELGRSPVSDSTIYRAVHRGQLDYWLGGTKKASCRLRRKGKPRRNRDLEELRGKIKISHSIDERPAVVEGRSRIGDWEGDTVLGRSGGACLLTMVDRKSGYLVGGKSPNKRKEQMSALIVKTMRGHVIQTITLDRGKEFALHAEVSKKLKVEFYFALPHHPWQRGTNENTNGLLREYFPKGKEIDSHTDAEIQAVYDELNHRPRKRLGWKTPFEIYRETALHLI